MANRSGVLQHRIKGLRRCEIEEDHRIDGAGIDGGKPQSSARQRVFGFGFSRAWRGLHDDRMIPRDNAVVVFDRDAHGQLTKVGEVSTQGMGTGGALDPLGSQGSMALTEQRQIGCSS